jgi:hypothetical protein
VVDLQIPARSAKPDDLIAVLFGRAQARLGVATILKVWVTVLRIEERYDAIDDVEGEVSQLLKFFARDRLGSRGRSATASETDDVAHDDLGGAWWDS